MMRVKWLQACACGMLAVVSGVAFAQEAPAPVEEGTVRMVDTPVVTKKKSFGHKLLWYLPNRLMDITDVLRLRLRFGPGYGASVRATEYISAYGGSYRSVYVGVPGPRRSVPSSWPAGQENLKGLVVLGVDATDDDPHPPGYSESELSAGLHLLVVGGDIGFDPVEFVDFFGGLIFIDPVSDDR